jgi:steroid delta-isomerase-like uncharacterized protein
MSSLEANKDLIREYYEATTDRGEIEMVDRLLSPDFRDHDAAPGTPPGVEGVKHALAMIRHAFPDIRVIVEDMVAEGEFVAVRASWRGTHKGVYFGIAPTYRLVEMHGMAFWRIEAGKAVERWVNWDRLGLLRQLGAIAA